MAKPLPLDDPRWLPLKAAIDQRERQRGAMPLAVLDIEKATASGKLRAKRCNILTGEEERLDAGFWPDREVDVMPTGSVVIFRKSSERPADRPRRWGDFDHYPDQRMDQHAYFVWQPDLEKLFGAQAEVESGTPYQRGPGGGAKRKLSADIVKRGKEFLRRELDIDPGWADHFEACSKMVKNRLSLTCHWQTAGTWIVNPVLIERGLRKSSVEK